MKEQYFYLSFSHANFDELKKKLQEIQEAHFFVVRIFIAGDFELIQDYEEFLKGFPCIFIGNTTSCKSEVHYFCIQAVKEDFIRKEYILNEEKLVGAYVVYKNTKQLFLSSLDSFDQVEGIIQQYQFSGKDIVRFWNYMENVLEVYDDFNKARNSFFEKENITDYPAATGIDARIGRSLSLSFDAIQGAMEVKTLHSDMQCEAWYYGPKFSRGKGVNFAGGKKIYISGTSAVDLEGNSILLDDPIKNVEYVLESIEHLLHKEEAFINDIIQCFVYCKSQKYYEVFLDIYEKRSYTFLFVPVFVNICRDDFFFEVEGIL